MLVTWLTTWRGGIIATRWEKQSPKKMSLRFFVSDNWCRFWNRHPFKRRILVWNRRGWLTHILISSVLRDWLLGNVQIALFFDRHSACQGDTASLMLWVTIAMAFRVTESPASTHLHNSEEISWKSIIQLQTLTESWIYTTRSNFEALLYNLIWGNQKKAVGQFYVHHVRLYYLP